MRCEDVGVFDIFHRPVKLRMKQCYTSDALAAGWRRMMHCRSRKKVSFRVWLKNLFILLKFYFAGRGGFETINLVKLDVSERLRVCPSGPCHSEPGPWRG